MRLQIVSLVLQVLCNVTEGMGVGRIFSRGGNSCEILLIPLKLTEKHFFY